MYLPPSYYEQKRIEENNDRWKYGHCPNCLKRDGLWGNNSGVWCELCHWKGQASDKIVIKPDENK